jgi:quinol monooxygenase YgiN
VGQLITFIVHLRVPPGNAEAFEDLMTYVCAMSNEQEPGVLYYAFAKSVDEADTYVTVEVYRDQAAVAAHGDTVWVRDSVPKSLELIDGMPRIMQYVSPGAESVITRFEELT